MRLLTLRPSAHQGDFVVDNLGVGAQEHGASTPVLFGDLHTKHIAVKGDHALQVADVNPHVSKSCYSWHRSLPVVVLRVVVIVPPWAYASCRQDTSESHHMWDILLPPRPQCQH